MIVDRISFMLESMPCTQIGVQGSKNSFQKNKIWNPTIVVNVMNNSDLVPKSMLFIRDVKEWREGSLIRMH